MCSLHHSSFSGSLAYRGYDSCPHKHSLLPVGTWQICFAIQSTVSGDKAHLFWDQTTESLKVGDCLRDWLSRMLWPVPAGKTEWAFALILLDRWSVSLSTTEDETEGQGEQKSQFKD